MHEAIRFHRKPDQDGGPNMDRPGDDIRPRHLDLKKDTALTIRWSDGRVSIYPIAYLRKMSPSADARELRKQMERNPLTVLPAGVTHEGPLTATGIEPVGNYAIRISFSDGHQTGIYSWRYLREIDPNRPPEAKPKPDSPGV